MKTAIDHIIEFLKKHDGFVLSGDIHNHMCGEGYRRGTSEKTLSKLVCDGALIREGEGCYSRCRINTEYSPATVINKNRGNANSIFDEYRANSRIYDIDKRLQRARAENATERQHNLSHL